METIRQRLLDLRDENYAAFERRLIPNVPGERILGVRTPALRSLAKELRKAGAYSAFLSELPHGFFEENQLHAFLVCEEKDWETAIAQTEAFLPYLDNWATCDQFSPRVFRRRRRELLEHIPPWLDSPRPYTVRFGIGMLMQHFLDEDFAPEYPAMVAAVSSEEYYVRMMQAWYFATALAKQYDAVLPYLQEDRLEPWVRRKTIQKALESYRIPPERKAVLKALRKAQGR